MATLNAAQKQKLGQLLLKLHRNEHGYTEEEWKLAKVLEGRGLAKYIGPDQSPKVMSATDYYRHAQLCALSHYSLTGLGEDFVLRHKDKEHDLLSGRYLL